MKDEKEIKEIEQIMLDGFSAAYSSDHEKAIIIGKELIKRRHSSGFEILALGYQHKGNLKKAIVTLETGVKKAPNVFKMWQLLGNLYSYTGKFQKSYDAYKRGMECPNTDLNSLNLNFAVALERDNKNIEAFEKINEISTVDADNIFNISYWSTKFRIQNSLERFKQTIDEYKKIIKEIDIDNIDKNLLPNIDEFISNIHCEDALALWKTNKNNNEINEIIEKSILADKHNDKTKWLIREIRKSKSEYSYHFHIMINGEWTLNKSEDGKDMDFFTTYDVVAETEEEALGFIKQFEPPAIRDKIKIEEVKEKRKFQMN